MHYHERVFVPTSWWGIGLFFSLSFVTAVGFYAGPWVALIAAIATAAAVAIALVWYGRIEIAVDEVGLTAGGATLEWAYLGAARALSKSETQLRLRAEADHRAWLVIRGYLPTSVEVEVTDPLDPHPYWLVSTRHPEELAQALTASRPRP